MTLAEEYSMRQAPLSVDHYEWPIAQNGESASLMRERGLDEQSGPLECLKLERNIDMW